MISKSSKRVFDAGFTESASIQLNRFGLKSIESVRGPTEGN
jgi:hypothetical protein